MKRATKNKVWRVLKILCGRKYYELLRARYNLGYFPDLKNPKTFNEKVIYKKFFSDMDYAVDLTDKYKIRAYIEEKIGKEYLLDIYFAGDNFTKADWDALPNQFVIKATQGGGDDCNIFVHNKAEENFDDISVRVKENLKKRFGYYTNEDWYLKIEPSNIVEKLMIDETGRVPTDYKFFCFHGKAHFIQTNSDRYTGHRRSFFDTKWNKLDFYLGHIPSTDLEKPELLDEMTELAEKLAQDFDFVRVDLYAFQNKIYFGELTFIPNGGHEAFHPKEMDDYYGSLLNVK